MKKNIVFLAFIVLLAHSCQKKEYFVSEVNDRITATIHSVSVKSYIGSDGLFYWSPGDALSVFNSPSPNKYRMVDTSSCRIGSFERVKNKIEPQYNTDYVTSYAIHPYNSMITANTFADSAATFNMTVKQVQSYQKNTFDPQAVIAAASGVRGNPNYNFYAVVGYLSFSIKGKCALSSLKLRGNDGEKIAGKTLLSISGNPEVEPYLTMASDALTEVSIDCEDTKLSATPTIFMFTLPPVEFKKGITLEIIDVDGNISTKTTNIPISIEKNTITPISLFECELTEDSTFNPRLISFSIDVKGKKYYAMDITGENITVVVPYGTDLSALKPEFSVEGGILYSGGDIQQSGLSSHDFSTCHSVDYSIVGAKTQKDFSVRVIDSKNPVVYIKTNNHEPILDRENWLDSTIISIVKPDGTYDLVPSLAKIKGRGNNSWATAPNKKPYAIKFLEQQKVLGMPKHKRWCLLNEALGDIMFNEFGFEMARQATTDLDWTPHGKGVEIVLNGDYRGYYFLTEQIRIDKDRVNITEIKKSLPLCSTPSGGYLFEFSKSYAHFYTGVIQWNLNNKGVPLGFPVEIHNPEKDNFSTADFATFSNYLRNYLNAFESTLVDPIKFAKHEYDQYIDVDSFIDAWFIFEIIGLTDPLAPRSVWMYKDVDGGVRGGKIVAGPMWDLVGGLYCASDHSKGFVCDQAIYYPYLLKSPEFVARVKEKWAYTYDFLKNTFFIEDTLDELVDEIGHAVDNNNYRWAGEHKIKTAQNRATHIETNIPYRLENLNKAISEL